MDNLTGNQILKNMIEKVDDRKKRELLSILSIDVKTCEPIVNPKITKENKENLCIYLDNNFKLVGFLKGSTVLTKYDNIFVQGFRYFNRNKKNISLHSTYVLMFTDEMRTVKINEVVNEKVTVEKSLDLRLKEYKNDKYKDISVNDMKEIIKSISLKLSNDILTNELPKKFKNAKTTIELISKFSELAQDFMDKATTYENDINRLKAEGNGVYVNYWSNEAYLKVKNEVLFWNNLVK